MEILGKIVKSENKENVNYNIHLEAGNHSQDIPSLIFQTSRNSQRQIPILENKYSGVESATRGSNATVDILLITNASVTFTVLPYHYAILGNTIVLDGQFPDPVRITVLEGEVGVITVTILRCNVLNTSWYTSRYIIFFTTNKIVWVFFIVYCFLPVWTDISVT